MKYALIYGLLSGFVIIATMIAGIALSDTGSFFSSEWFGYLVMLVALTFIFVGVKRYRDVERGGVIKFMPAFAMGLGIAAAAGVAYVTVWEAYLAMTNYAFMDQYIAGVMRARQAQGLPAAAMAAGDRQAGIAAHQLRRSGVPAPDDVPGNLSGGTAGFDRLGAAVTQPQAPTCRMSRATSTSCTAQSADSPSVNLPSLPDARAQ